MGPVVAGCPGVIGAKNIEIIPFENPNPTLDCELGQYFPPGSLLYQKN